MRSFGAPEVRALLDELAERLAAAGISGSIKIAGGAAMLLNYPDDPAVRVTRDIDAMIEPSGDLERIVAEMAEDLGLPARWLNAAGSGWLRVSGTPVASGSLSVSVASPRELIAMKLAAGRDKDASDLVLLARHEGLTDPAALVDIAYEVYGEDSVELPDGRQSYLWFASDVMAEVQRLERYGR
ncbi:DUF6036 family nucleotidyltransferase [Agromyces mediolanus]|uniref:DUF6036 family nucleotidyltransferase n=1 Tax=Agromyces mediolanus TaxID=41986 RepID=UPI0020409F5B|nr:DUF6036 family nucleotidyltransferase [Agromyces mediolanus]MCM3656432.1 DUF6036 family nucleotidyltransferase [Agromyces mediolanus]